MISLYAFLERYGKFFVLDLMDIDGLWAGVEQRMNDIQTNLLKDLMDMSLIKQNKLIRVTVISYYFLFSFPP